MTIFKKIQAEVPLRAGFALMYLYSGLDLIRNPQNWRWAVESAFENFSGPLESLKKLASDANIDSFLQVQGIVEITFAALLVSWFFPRWVLRTTALAIAVEMALILWLLGVNASSTFRDIGLLGGALALFLLSYKRR